MGKKKVRILKRVVPPSDQYGPGQGPIPREAILRKGAVVELDAALAARYVAGGIAEAVDGPAAADAAKE